VNAGPTKEVRIDVFRAEHAAAFEALNRAWLVDHGLYEAPDEEQLSDPWGTIIEPGGQVFVALRGDEVLGTCALIPYQPGILELAKLAVAPEARGRGLGRALVEACLGLARRRGIGRVVLVSSSRLGAALSLYESLGFRRGPLPRDVPYATADVYMELDLSAPSTEPAEYARA
jgi:ribosomal protein S18 acetylase RimI-like enzyme